jgi:uncharacterized membrane protein YcaP (DUF421 family)
MSDWIVPAASAPLMVVLTGLAVYVTLLLCVRIAGLRSFAKASSFDFAVTVAIGSLLASTIITREPPLLQGIAGLLLLFAMQYVVSSLRRRSDSFARVVDNRPALLMAHGETLSDALDRVRMTEEDLRSKLRMAGIVHPNEVFAAVMETTGDVAVIRTPDAAQAVDPRLFEGVRGAERLRLDDAPVAEAA